MEDEELTNPVVRGVIEAMNTGDQAAFFAAFADDVQLTDDGEARPFAEWAHREIFDNHAQLEVTDEEEEGMHLAGPFHSDQWGTFLTVWKFQLHDEKVTRLDVAAA
jgi:hypothetical protein